MSTTGSIVRIMQRERPRVRGASHVSGGRRPLAGLAPRLAACRLATALRSRLTRGLAPARRLLGGCRCLASAASRGSCRRRRLLATTGPFARRSADLLDALFFGLHLLLHRLRGLL